MIRGLAIEDQFSSSLIHLIPQLQVLDRIDV